MDIIITLYPIIATAQTLIESAETQNLQNLQKWACFWLVFQSFQILNQTPIALIPCYSILKYTILLGMYSHRVQSIVCRYFIIPIIKDIQALLSPIYQMLTSAKINKKTETGKSIFSFYQQYMKPLYKKVI